MNNGDVESKVEQLPEKQDQTVTIKVYKIRWLILGLFVAFSASNSMQWILFSIIADVVIRYYGISTVWVDWTSLIFMVLYTLFVFPGSYLLEKLGLRIAVLIGIIGTCVGSWVKVGAVHPDRFWLAFVGQFIVGISEVFILSIPARLAAVWFGPSQVSSACSIGVFGNQLGVAVGFLIPPIIVRNNENLDTTTKQFYILFIGTAVVTTVLLILILIFFKNAPDTPPSYAAAQQGKSEGINFLASLKNLTKNRCYMLLVNSYGINVGIYYAISTLLNQIILKHYPGASQDAGRIGLVMIVAGMFGSIACGVVLDKFHKFRETTLVVYVFSLLGMIAYTFTLDQGIYIVYIVSALLGFFMTGLLPVGFELAAELTYPEPEGTSAGLLNASSQVYGIIFTNVYSAIFYNVGDSWANVTMCVMLTLGTILTACVGSSLKRQAAHNSTENIIKD